MLRVEAATEITAQLDDLLHRVGVKLQLSETAYRLAQSRYQTIAEWLSAQNSPFAAIPLNIFPQGSLRINTTIKPLARSEYDLDLVCLVVVNPENFKPPTILLDALEYRLRQHGLYKDMLERKNRCIRVKYANQFHLDILPACPNPSNGLHGHHCVLVPDSHAQAWKHSNPKGYAQWFEQRAEEAFANFKERHIEPLQEQQSYAELATLQRVVQLMKRYRDISLAKHPEKRRPISIVLTTLAATAYTGHPSVTEALLNILDRISYQIPDITSGQRLIVLNPTNDREDLSERWDDDPEAYLLFVDWVNDFRRGLRTLLATSGLHHIKGALEKMFGETIAYEAVAEHLKFYEGQRQQGTLATQRNTGLIVPATITATTQIRSNTFFGNA